MSQEAQRHDLVIVGAGAAGLWAAIQAAIAAAAAQARSAPDAGAPHLPPGPGPRPLRIVLIDHREKVAAKILMSGGTRCNLTHDEVLPEDYRGGNRNRIARVLRAHPASESLRFFTEVLGVPVRREPGGKIFPADDKATTVRAALLAAVERAGIPLLRGRRWSGLAPAEPLAGVGGPAPGPREPRWRLLWQDPGGRTHAPIETARVLVATGGCSFPESGSDGSGLAILRGLGHTVAEPLPALTPFRLGGGVHAGLAGIATPVRLRLEVAGRSVSVTEGPMLWTHTGVSGPAALDLSGPWVRARHDQPEAESRVRVNFLPNDSAESLEARWLEEASRSPARTIRTHFASLPQRLAEVLIRTAGADPAQPLAQTPRALRRAVIAHLVGFTLPVEGVLGFGKAEVTSGGVPLEEVDGGLESRILPGVHLAGEVLHVDGRLGGFNFQWAWSSGAVAARAAVARLLGSDAKQR